jgi:protocatechuate 3,4-dioxygenase beta subunit
MSDHDDHRRDPRITRRGALRGLAGTGAGFASLGLLRGSAEQDAFAATPSCTLTAEVTEGPYYLDLERVRRNVTEGKTGLRLDLRIKVVDSSSCEALSGVAVDIWHAAADGHYSGFAAEGTNGETWLRGVQLTDDDGIAAFRTIYPGWYQGRATHIHMKCHLGGRVSSSTYRGGHVAHTGQLFFRDTTTDRVARLSPYSSRTITRTRNSADSIYRQAGGSGAILALTRRGSSIRSGFTGRITVGIDPDATPSAVN